MRWAFGVTGGFLDLKAGCWLRLLSCAIQTSGYLLARLRAHITPAGWRWRPEEATTLPARPFHAPPCSCPPACACWSRAAWPSAPPCWSRSPPAPTAPRWGAGLPTGVHSGGAAVAACRRRGRGARQASRLAGHSTAPCSAVTDLSAARAPPSPHPALCLFFFRSPPAGCAEPVDQHPAERAAAVCRHPGEPVRCATLWCTGRRCR